MKRNKISLTEYEIIPEDMKMYLMHYGKHFSKKMYEWAVKLMYKKDTEKINTVTKEEYRNKLAQYGIHLENDVLYDGMYVLAMVEADFYKSSVPTEEHKYRYVKDVIDDVDQVDGFIFNRFYADCMLKGIPIDWEEMI
jgi:hypothetical protein